MDNMVYASGVFFLIGSTLLGIGLYLYNKERRIDRIPVLPIKDIMVGDVAVRGTVQDDPSGMTYTAPRSGRKCLYWRLEEKEYYDPQDDSGHDIHHDRTQDLISLLFQTYRRSNPPTLSKQERGGEFVLSDGGGKVLVDARSANLRMETKNETRIGNRVFVENIISPGMELKVVGGSQRHRRTVSDPAISPYHIFYGGPSCEFLITDRKEGRLSKEGGSNFIALSMVGGATIVLGLVVLIIGVARTL